ncbi:hypothetical protein I4U23_027367 [Adineta vaga]|nr:hypothetical protein I4U23_027367 [Adineta vaga]
MPRNERSVCGGCGKSSDSCVVRRAKNNLLRLFVSVRSSKYLQPEDQICVYGNLLNDHFSVDENEDDEHEEQIIIKTTTSDRETQTDDEPLSIVIPIRRTSKSHGTCIVCSANVSSSSHLLSEEQRKIIFFKRGVFIPKGVRCCRDHIDNKQLKYEAIEQISAPHYDELSLDTEGVQNMISDFNSFMTNVKIFDFDDPTSLSDESYFNFTGLQKELFYRVVLIEIDAEFHALSDETNRRSTSGTSPLFVAYRNGHDRIVKHLLKHGANPFHCQTDLRSPLHTALLYNKSRCARLLLRNMLSVSIEQTDIYGWSHLHFLAKKGSLQASKVYFHHLKINGITYDVKQIDHFGNTALHIPAFNNQTKFIKFLLEKGFDSEQENLSGWKPSAIVADHQQKNNNNDVVPNDYFQYLLSNHHIRYTLEEEKMGEEVKTYVKMLVSQLEKLDPLFSNTIICSGSYYEKTRVDSSNEFDYMISLTILRVWIWVWVWVRV